MIITSFNGSCSEQILRSCAKLYCEIWRETPWNEDFWTVEGVMEDLEKQIGMLGAKGFFAMNGREVSGFTWGYCATQADMRRISGGERLDRLFCSGECVFYLTELGVCPSLRNHKIGERLIAHLLEDVARDGIRSVVLRTDIKASAASHLYQKMGFRDLQVRDAKYGNRTYWLLAVKPSG